MVSNRIRLEKMDRWRFLGGKAGSPAPPAPEPHLPAAPGLSFAHQAAADSPYSHGPYEDHAAAFHSAASAPQMPLPLEREVKIDLRYLSVACYFAKLIEWAKQSEVPQQQQQQQQQQPAKSGANIIFGDGFLFGEVVRDKCAYDEDSAAQESPGEVVVTIDSKSSKYTLLLRGDLTLSRSLAMSHSGYPCDDRVTLADKRLQRLQQMVDDTIQIRQIHQLSSYWKRQHRLGISDSDVINAQEEQSRSCVLFHHSGPTTLVEIVSLRHNQHNRMKKFLDSLVPRECKREVPVDCILQYDDVAWEALRKRFALIVEVVDASKHFPLLSPPSLPGMSRGFDFQRQQQSNFSHRGHAQCVTVSAWGFGTLIDQAFEFLLVSSSLPAQESTRDRADRGDRGGAREEAYFPYGKGAVQDPAPYFEPPVDLGKHQDMGKSAAPILGSRNVKGSYTFQDCEAGIFFFAFEKDFRVGRLGPPVHRPALISRSVCLSILLSGLH